MLDETAEVAIVHDYITQRGGAERVVLSLLTAFPSAVLYTTMFEPGASFPEFAGQRIVTSPLNHLGLLRRHHRLALPVLAPAVSLKRVRARVTICSSSGWAHGFHVTGRKVVYCYAPARWLYQEARYLGEHNILGRAALRAMGSPLRSWDRRAALGADRYLVVSNAVRQLVEEVYGIHAEVVPPPVTLDLTGASKGIDGIGTGFFLLVSRLLPYKNVHVALEAFRELPDQRLVVVGTGPEHENLSRDAPSNVVLLGTVTDEELRWLYMNTTAVVAPSFEDFGLTPLEGALNGKPTVAVRAGGYLDTVVEGTTGIFFNQASAQALRSAVTDLLSCQWDDKAIREHASLFSEERFASRLREVVRGELAALAP